MMFSVRYLATALTLEVRMVLNKKSEIILVFSMETLAYALLTYILVVTPHVGLTFWVPVPIVLWWFCFKRFMYRMLHFKAKEA